VYLHEVIIVPEMLCCCVENRLGVSAFDLLGYDNGLCLASDVHEVLLDGVGFLPGKTAVFLQKFINCKVVMPLGIFGSAVPVEFVPQPVSVAYAQLHALVSAEPIRIVRIFEIAAVGAEPLWAYIDATCRFAFYCKPSIVLAFDSIFFKPRPAGLFY